MKNICTRVIGMAVAALLLFCAVIPVVTMSKEMCIRDSNTAALHCENISICRFFQLFFVGCKPASGIKMPKRGKTSVGNKFVVTQNTDVYKRQPIYP